MHKGMTCKVAAWMRRHRAAAALAALALGLSAAHAQDRREQAVNAAFADGITTAVGVAASGGVINPVGPLLTTAMKALTFQRASELPETDQPAAYAAASAMWMGGTVSNVCITAVFLSGGGFAPACLAVGAAWGLKEWDDSEHERRFWERCAIVRQFAERENIECLYVPGKLALAKETVARPAPVKGRAVKTSLRAATLILTPSQPPADPYVPPQQAPHDIEAP